MFRGLVIIIVISLLWSCDTSKLSPTSMSKFQGKWSVETGMLKGAEIEIYKIEGKDKFRGKIIKLNDNKYVQLFVSEGDVIITNIKRFSNFKFEFTQKRVAAELMSIYEVETSDKFEVQFGSKNNIVSANNEEKVLFKKVSE